MNLKKKTFHGNSTLHLKFGFKAENRSFTSSQFVIGGLVVCQFRAEVNYIYYQNTGQYSPKKITLFEKFTVVDEGMDVLFTIGSRCHGINSVPADEEGQKVELKISDDIIIVTNKNSDIWHYKGTVTANEQKSEYEVTFTITIQEVCPGPSAFSILYEDTTLPDFMLCSGDESISFHKAVLAASSPMLNAMLSGEWKEASKGKVELAGVTKETLTNLKSYMYLKNLPHRPDNAKEIDYMHDQLEELLKLACYLMMTDMVQACSAQFLLDLTNENAFKLISLAGVYKIKTLTKGVILSHHHGSIDLIENGKFPGDWI